MFNTCVSLLFVLSFSLYSNNDKDLEVFSENLASEGFQFFGIPKGAEDVPTSNTQKEKMFLYILNQARKEKNMQPLMLVQDLNRAARYHSYDMASQGYFEHDTYDINDTTGMLDYVCSAYDRITKFINSDYYERYKHNRIPLKWDGIKKWDFSSYGAENCARGNVTALDAYNAWYNSPGHYANMFNPDFKVIGIGYIQLPGSKYTHYWTTDFGI